MSYSASGDAPERAGGQAGAPPPGSGPETTAPGTTAPETSGTGTTGADTAATETTAPPRRGQVPRTKTAVAWNTLIAGSIVLILLLVFILENTKSVHISYFGAGFQLPLGVALLLAAIGGALLAGIIGTARIVQLRRRIRRAR